VTESPKSCADTLTGNLDPCSTTPSPTPSAEDAVTTAAGTTPKGKDAAVPRATPKTRSLPGPGPSCYLSQVSVRFSSGKQLPWSSPLQHCTAGPQTDADVPPCKHMSYSNTALHACPSVHPLVRELKSLLVRTKQIRIFFFFLNPRFNIQES